MKQTREFASLMVGFVWYLDDAVDLARFKTEEPLFWEYAEHALEALNHAWEERWREAVSALDQSIRTLEAASVKYQHSWLVEHLNDCLGQLKATKFDVEKLEGQ